MEKISLDIYTYEMIVRNSERFLVIKDIVESGVSISVELLEAITKHKKRNKLNLGGIKIWQHYMRLVRRF